MAPPLLSLSDIHLTFGRTPLLTGANLMVFPNDRICLVGRNGSGKSTLLKIAAGFVEPDKGERFVKPGITWRYLPQEPDLSGFETLEEFVRDGLIGAEQDYRIPYLLDALKIDGARATSHLSGGETRRAALARTLAPEPDILLLDEPTNHLDLPAIEWLEDELSSQNTALILISHDRRFLTQLSRKTVFMDRGLTRSLDSGFADFETWRDELFEQEALEQHKLERKIVREQHWVVHGVSGRRKRNVRRLKELSQLRADVKSHRDVAGSVQFQSQSAQTSGKLVARLENVEKSFGDRTLIKDFSLRLSRGERLGIVGPNGVGKTTLLKLIMGELEADAGEIELGVNLEPLIIDQKRESLNPNWTLSDALTDGGSDNVVIGDKSVHVQQYMRDFLFLPEQVRTPLHVLSGGERARVQLARGLRHPSNLLILDEPTNDLDLETLDLLQELIADYDGTVILVSHDRDFIDRIVTRTVAWLAPGEWGVFAGGYTDMLSQRPATQPTQAAQARQKSTPQAQDKAQSNIANSRTSKTNTSRLSYKHKYRLEQLPSELNALRSEIVELEAALSDPKLFNAEPEKFKKLADTLTQKNTQLEALEDEWLELEILKEDSE